MNLNESLPIATPDGYFVSQDHIRIAQIIQDFDPELFLVFIPPSKRDHNDPNEKPFALAHMPEGKPSYIVSYFDECDERILEFAFMNDTRRHDVLARLEAADAAREAVKLKKMLEEEEMKQDLVASIVRSPKHQYKHDGVTYE